MILRRYGSSMHSVELNFDSKALTEIGFRRADGTSIPVERFREEWERVEERAFACTAEGPVQDETEQDLLDLMEGEILEWLEGFPEGDVLVVESESGVDHPKTRHRSSVIVERGENRLHFKAWVEPPLRLARYRRRS